MIERTPEDRERFQQDMARFAPSDCRRRFEIEGQRRGAALEHLWRMSNDDVTVRTFIDAWRHGSFPSFEEMLCQLAVQLVEEKRRFAEMATVTFPNAMAAQPQENV